MKNNCEDCRCDNCHEHDNCILIPEKIKRKLNGELPIRPHTKLAKFLQQELNLEQKRDRIGEVYNITFTELLESVVMNPLVDIKQFLLDKSSSVRGNLFQGLWMIMIVLDRVEPFTSKNFHIIDGKIERDMDLITPRYLDKGVFFGTNFNAGNKSGISDLTFKVKTESDQSQLWACEMTMPMQKERYVLASFKFYNKEKGVSDYDVQDIVEAMETYARIRGSKCVNYNIALFVHNKNAVLEKLNRTTKKHMVDDVRPFALQLGTGKDKKGVVVETLYDLKDLISCIERFREECIGRGVGDIIKKPNLTVSLAARFHQLLFVKKTIDAISEGQKLFVWGQIARSGKTYTAGLLVSHLWKNGYMKAVMQQTVRPFITMVITPAPSETLEQFYDDLFLKFKADFGEFDVMLFDSRTKDNVKNVCRNIDKPIVLICSKQFLHGGIGKDEGDTGDTGDEAKQMDEGERKTYMQTVRKTIERNLDFLKCKGGQPKVNLVIFDEVHAGGGTEISQTILNVLDSHFVRDKVPTNDGNVIKVFLTATFKRPVDLFKVKSHQLMTWGIDDIELCKFIADKSAYANLCKRFNTDKTDYVGNTISELRKETILSKGEFLESLQTQYQNFPSLLVMSAVQDQEWLQNTLKFNLNEYGTDRTKLFALTQEKKREFVNVPGLRDLLRYIGDFKLENGIFRRVHRVFGEHGQNRPFMSYMWFIPYFEGNRIADVSEALKELLETDPVLKPIYDPYSIVIAGEGVDKRRVKTEEVKAFQNRKTPCKEGDGEKIHEDLEQGKRGMILLAGKKFSLGVSFPCVDVVLFLNNDKDVDIIYQRMFRALTESRNKKFGVLVDLLPYRTIHTLIEYALPPHIEKKISKGKDVVGVAMNGFDYFYKNRTVLFDSDKLKVGRDKEDVYKRLYSSIEAYLRKGYDVGDVGTIKNAVEDKLGAAFGRLSKSFLGHFVKAGDDLGKHLVLLEPDEEEVVPKKKGKKREPGEPPEKKAKPDVSEKELEKIRKSLLKTFVDMLVVCPILLKDEDTKYANKSFEEIILKVVKTYGDIEECDKVDDEVGTNDERYIASVYNIMLNKMSLLVKPDAMANKCKLVSGFMKMVLNLLHEQNLFPYLNSEYNSMKHIVDVKSSNIEELYAFVEKYLPPKDLEKKLYGEVFTPLSLVKEMLDSIEKYADKKFWENPDLKILDPAAGIGNFPVVAYAKLMEGLKKKIPNEEKRRKHILENMLYMVELNGTNVRLMKKIFSGGTYALNIITGDFLAEKKQRNLKNMLNSKELKFDLVMGNPPWQDSVEGIRKGGYGGKVPLWEKFVTTIMTGFCKPEGLLVFMHPPSWRKPEHHLLPVFKTKQMLYLSINGEDKSQKTFDVTQRFDWYVLQNKSYTKKTLVKGEIGDLVTAIDFREWPFIPNYHFNEIKNLLAKPGEDRCEILYDTAYHTQKKETISSSQTDDFKYPCIHTMNKDGIGFVYSKTNDKGHFGIPKVLLSFGRYQYPYANAKGDYCMSQIVFGIPVKNKKEADLLVKALNTPRFQEIIKATKWSTFITDYRMFRCFSKYFWKDFL